MKAEERHRLQTNELSVWTARAGDYWRQYGTFALLAAIVLVIAVGVVMWWRGHSAAQASAGWDALRAARSGNKAADYAEVAERYPGTAVAAWAKLYEGKIAQRTGAQLVFEDRKGAYRELDEARKAFEDVLANDAAAAVVREQALFRLAQTLETLAGVRESDTSEAAAASLDDATAAYERLLKEYPETVLKPFVEERVANLKSDSTRDFYTWFAQQNPSPADRRAPRDRATSSEFDLPDLDSLLQRKPAADTAPTSPPQPDTPAGTTADDEPVEAPNAGGAP